MTLDDNKLTTLMARLAKELREIQHTTEHNKNFRMDGLVFAESAEDEAILRSKEQEAIACRAATALLDVYDNLGALELAKVVAEIRGAMNGEKNIRFSLAAAGVILEHYDEVSLTIEPTTVEEKPDTTTEKPVLIEAPKPTKPWRIKKAIPTLVSLGIAGASAGGFVMERNAEARAKADVNTAIRESIDLRVTPDQTAAQKRRLMELQEIEIPELREQIDHSTLRYLAAAGFLSGLFAALFCACKMSVDANLEAEAENAQAHYPTEDNAELPSTRAVMQSINEIIAEACCNARPSIRPSELPARHSMGR